jgi:hypothetical protein
MGSLRLALLLVAGLTQLSSARLVVSYDIGATDGSVLVGTALLEAADKLSLLRAAGLDGLQDQQQSTTESAYTDFGGVADASDGLVNDYRSAGSSSDVRQSTWVDGWIG